MTKYETDVKDRRSKNCMCMLQKKSCQTIVK